MNSVMSTHSTFNRTILEWKLYTRYVIKRGFLLLIEPFWNGNKEIVSVVLVSKEFSFNRTILEWKLEKEIHRRNVSETFNRTILEWKQLHLLFSEFPKLHF